MSKIFISFAGSLQNELCAGKVLKFVKIFI